MASSTRYGLTWYFAPSHGNHLLRQAALRPDNQSYMVWQLCDNSSQWRHNERDGISNHQRLNCLLNCVFRRKSKKTSKLRVTGPCAGISWMTGEFPTQNSSNPKMFPFDDVTMFCHPARQRRILRGDIPRSSILKSPWQWKMSCSCVGSVFQLFYTVFKKLS